MLAADKDWYHWCRLCANEDDKTNINIFLKGQYCKSTKRTQHTEFNLPDAIAKYFCVQINKDEKFPNQICTKCFALVAYIVGFSKSVAKVQEMYISLHNSKVTSEVDIQSLRLKHGVTKNVMAGIFVPNLIKEYTDKNISVLTDAANIQEIPSYQNEIKTENFTDVPEFNGEGECEIQSFKNVETEPIVSEIEFNSKHYAQICHASYENAMTKHGQVEEFSSEKGIEEDPFASDTEMNYEIENNITDEDNMAEKNGGENYSDSTNKEAFEPKEYGEKKSAKTNTNKTLQANGNEEEKFSKSNTKKFSKPMEFKFFCNDCPLRFRRIGSYRLHLHKKHDIPLPTLTCSICSKIFKSEYDLKQHSKTHQPTSEKKIYPCPQCDRKFQNKDYVATHIKFVHEDIRPFICEECGESVRTEAALREHMLIHTDYAPFKCAECGKGFKNRPRLKKHLETHSSYKHTCGECGLQLNSRATLNRHRLVHSDEMPHKCDYCGRAFKRAKTLKSHLILHSGLKPYSCNFCDKTFANGANCRTHKLKSHPEELAALEASGEKTYTKNIPKLSVLKTVSQTVKNLTPVVSKKCKEKSFISVNSTTSVNIPLSWL